MYQKYTPTLSSRQSGLIEKWRKLQARLQRKIKDGSFYQLSRKKRQQLLLRLQRYARQLQRLGFSIKRLAIGSALALSLALAAPAQAQTFVEQTGMDNPFDSVDVGFASNPALVDIDADGDLDAFIGEYDGTINFFENTQISSTASLTVHGQVGELYPNPAQAGLVHIDYTSTKAEELPIRVVDVSGSVVIRQTLPVFQGANTLALDASGLQKGLYFLEIGAVDNPVQRKLVIE